MNKTYHIPESLGISFTLLHLSIFTGFSFQLAEVTLLNPFVSSGVMPQMCRFHYFFVYYLFLSAWL